MKFESAHFKKAGRTPEVEVRPGLKRQVLCYNDDIMLVRVTFGPEMVLTRPPLHTHHNSQSSCIVSGRFEFHHSGHEPVVLGPGDSFCIGPDVPHEAYCLEPGVIIDAFSPLHEDFL